MNSDGLVSLPPNSLWTQGARSSTMSGVIWLVRSFRKLGAFAVGQEATSDDGRELPVRRDHERMVPSPLRVTVGGRLFESCCGFFVPYDGVVVGDARWLIRSRLLVEKAVCLIRISVALIRSTSQ